MAVKEDMHAITILIVNHKDWTPQQLPITKRANIHTIVITISYDPTPKWPKYYQKTFVPHIHDMHAQPFKIHKKHYSSTITPPHYKDNPQHPNGYVPYQVQPHRLTHKFLRHVENHSQTTPTIPIPTNYNCIYPLKFHPQQCLCTNKSFIFINGSEGQLKGNTAWPKYTSSTTTPIDQKDYRATKILQA